MLYRTLADVIVILHLAFVLFAVFGGLLALRWRGSAWVHLPAVLWAGFIEFSGWICPLTPLENWLRVRGGEMGYRSGFIEHYILPVLYPAGLTRPIQFVLGTLVLAINVAVYAWVWRRTARPGG